MPAVPIKASVRAPAKEVSLGEVKVTVSPSTRSRATSADATEARRLGSARFKAATHDAATGAGFKNDALYTRASGIPKVRRMGDACAKAGDAAAFKRCG